MVDPSVKTSREDAAQTRCKQLIEYYQSGRIRYRLAFFTFQTLVIVGSSLTPILILSVESKVIQAIPATIAGVSAGLLSSFRFLDYWVHRATIAEALKSEQAKFVTRSGPDYNPKFEDSRVLDNFMVNIERLAADGLYEWRELRKKNLAELNDQTVPGSGSRTVSHA